MIVHIKINTDEALSLDEAKELQRQSHDLGLTADEVALGYLREGIRKEMQKISRVAKRPRKSPAK